MHPLGFSCGSHPGWLTRQLASVLALTLVAAAAGCREGAESPTAPNPRRARRRGDDPAQVQLGERGGIAQLRRGP